MASAITVLAWGGIAYPEGYEKAGQTGYLLDSIRWGTDYFIKCHVSQNELYGQVTLLTT
jgi:endoglucanase